MSDLFARLIGRARGTTAVVRPRVPTAFEAVVDTGEPLAEVHDVIDSVPRPVVRGEQPIESRPPLRPVVPREPAAREAPTVSQESPIRQPIEPAAPGEAEPAIREIVRAAEAARDVPTVPVVRVPTMADFPTLSPAAPPPARETAREVERTRVEHSIERVQDGSRTNRDAEAPAERMASGTRVQPADIRSVQPDPTPARQPPPESAPAPAGPPVVRVTIGRVDVRAVHDAPRERRKPAQQPARRMDLDEYLRRRNGGA